MRPGKHSSAGRVRNRPAFAWDMPSKRHQVQQAPRLPRKTKVNVTKCHACHVKRKWMSPSATPATQSTAPPPATNPGPSAPKRATKCNKRHTCHVKRKWMSPGATPAPQSTAPSPATNPGPSAPKRATKCNKCNKCHTCHAKRKWMSPGATPATQSNAASPATNPGPSAPKRANKCNKRHACHAKRKWMSPNATPATQNEGACHQVPRLPRKVPRRHRRPIRAQAHTSAPKRATKCNKRHACHAKRRWMSPNATAAKQNEGACHQGPRLPRKVQDGV